MPSEPDFEAFFEATPCPCLVLRTDMTIAAANGAYLRTMRLKRDDILDRSPFDVFTDNPGEASASSVREAFRASFERVFEERVPDAMAVQRYDLPRPDGDGFEERYWSPTSAPVIDPDGGVSHIILRIEDVTEYVLRTRRGEAAEAEVFRRGQELADANRRLREAQTSLQERNASLLAAYEELESFNYIVSHDLRAPLRSIDGFSQIVLEDSSERLDERDRDALRRVRAAAQQMSRQIDGLLELSRVTRVPTRRVPVDLSAAATEIAAELKRHEPDRGVEFTVAPGLTADGDERLLKTALWKLLENAWKYTGRHARARIEVGASRREGRTTFFVRDDGAGFEQAYAGRLFNPFQRLHASGDFPGLGVGLATAQRIVRRHGGRIWAEGRVEQGATFYFTLWENER